MPSSITGFEYDIFISYRHNDNRSGWVTDFVAALQEELGATIKQPVSIYFDRNPHDGLLETYNVDKSLEGKLKCLIFIPVISQTYCDPKSFAWQHEFLVFNRLSAGDQFGRHVKLINENVASRMLPVLIHDLDSDDRLAIETEMGEVMRSIEFIYREPGVNRPLKVADNKSDNQSKTDYRNQVNKVANAVKEMLVAIKSGPVQTHSRPGTVQTKGRNATMKILVLPVVFLLFLAGGYFLYSSVLSDDKNEPEKSVAVLAFADMSPGKDQEWFSDGLSEEILNSLAHLRELKVAARTSSFYYKGKDVPLQEIAKTLGVANIVEGSVRRNGEQLRITAQLIRASDGFHIWSGTYDRTADDVFQVQTEIAENIARTLLKELGAETKSSLSSSRPASLEAYEYYLKGTWTHLHRYWMGDTKYFNESERFLLKSISLDPGYADAYGALADLYDTRSLFPADQSIYRKKRDSLIQIGLKLDPNSPQIIAVNGWSFLKRARPNLDSAYYYFKKAYTLYPNTDYILGGIGGFYGTIGIRDAEIKYFKRASELDPLHVQALILLGNAYFMSGMYDDAKRHFEKAFELDLSNWGLHYVTGLMAANQGERDNFEKHLKILQTSQGIEETAAWQPVLKQLRALSFAMQGKKGEALALAPHDLLVLAKLEMKNEFLTQLDSIASMPIQWIDPHGLRQDPVYDFVRNEAQFKAIVVRVQKRYDSLLARYPPPN